MVNKFSGYGNRIPVEAVEGCIFRSHDSKQMVVVCLWEREGNWDSEKDGVPLFLMGEVYSLVREQMRLSRQDMKAEEGGKIKQ